MPNPLILDNCKVGQYECKSGDCIPDRWKCDSESDCTYGEDEENCPDVTCSSRMFKCHSDNRCIPHRWRCDGDPDCGGGEDERNCTSSSSRMECTSVEFKVTKHVF